MAQTASGGASIIYFDIPAAFFDSPAALNGQMMAGMGQAVHRQRSGFRRSCIRVTLACAAAYLLVCIGCASFQRRLIYFPPVLTAQSVEELGRSAGLERWVSPSGQPLGWKRLSPIQPAQGKVLVTHGNAGCAFQCGNYPDMIQQAAAFDVFLLEYPGYADHPGKPSEVSLDASADEALQVLAVNGPVYVVGESLGTGVAAHLAGRYPDKVAGLALLAPYDRLSAVAQAHMSFLPAGLLLCDRFPAADDLKTYRGAIAVLVGGQDTVVPEKFGRRLYEGYAGPKKLWEFPQATHGSLMFVGPQVWREVVGFWQSNSQRPGRTPIPKRL
jgi:uncharacterized protein